MKKLYFLSLTILMSLYSFGQATDLIISEYAEGTIGNSKYVEIFNGTGAAVDLAGYRIWTIANGGTWPEGTINLTGTLANNATFVIANNVTDVPGANLYITNCNWNSDRRDCAQLPRRNFSHRIGRDYCNSCSWIDCSCWYLFV
jgi:predicted extracellular nuclease